MRYSKGSRQERLLQSLYAFVPHVRNMVHILQLGSIPWTTGGRFARRMWKFACISSSPWKIFSRNVRRNVHFSCKLSEKINSINLCRTSNEGMVKRFVSVNLQRPLRRYISATLLSIVNYCSICDSSRSQRVAHLKFLNNVVIVTSVNMYMNNNYHCFRNKRVLSNSRKRLLFRGVVPGYLSRFQ